MSRAVTAVVSDRLSLLACLVAAVLGAVLWFPAAAAATGWTLATPPWRSATAARDLSAFPPSGLAVAGDGIVAVSADGGTAWSVHAPKGYESTAFTAVAFSSPKTGVTASGGLLLRTTDGGLTWNRPVYAGPGPPGQIVDLALRGGAGYAVGTSGMIFRTADDGASWQAETSPTAADIICVAVAGDGTVVAGTSAGEVLVRSSGAWTVVADVGVPVQSVAASSSPTWGDGQPDLFASAGPDLLGSDDGTSFAPLDGTPAVASWPALAWLGAPASSLLALGTRADGSIWSTSTSHWYSTSTGIGGTVVAAAPGDQSVAYVLGPDGRVARTFSAGRNPAATSLSSAIITAGGHVTFTAVVDIGAPGVVEIDRRVPGSAWARLQTWPWSSARWGRTIKLAQAPSLTTEYRLGFRYGGSWAVLSQASAVEVRPRLTPARLRYALTKGAVYRFAGRVTPALSGERVQLLTDRGGSWRPVAGNATVPVGAGGSWISRPLGTPQAETYHLRAHVPRTSRHGEAWSPVVTVVVR